MKTRRLKTRWGNKQTKEFRMIGKRSRARLGKQGSPAKRTEVIGQSQSKPWGCCQVQKMRLARKAVAVSMDVTRIKMTIQEMNAKAHEDT